jgi:Sphingosine kinase and enzymes related to eukaryotic diacylglycerol kinase
MKHRVILVHNLNSSHAKEVTGQVIKPLNQLFPKGVITYEILTTSFEENVANLSNILHENDLVIAAGGDGTAVITANGVLATKHRNIRLGILGFGNFNDMAHTFSGGKKATVQDLVIHNSNTVDVYPLEIKINDEHFRYSMLYATIGLVAGSVYEFEKPTNRKRLRSGGANFIVSFATLLPYYLKNKNIKSIPEYRSKEEIVKNTTDYLAINGPRMSKITIGDNHHLTNKFKRVTLDTSRFVRTLPFVAKSLSRKMPGQVVESDELVFSTPTDLEIQTDGEYRKLERVSKVDISKPNKHLNIIKL